MDRVSHDERMAWVVRNPSTEEIVRLNHYVDALEATLDDLIDLATNALEWYASSDDALSVFHPTGSDNARAIAAALIKHGRNRIAWAHMLLDEPIAT